MFAWNQIVQQADFIRSNRCGSNRLYLLERFADTDRGLQYDGNNRGKIYDDRSTIFNFMLNEINMNENRRQGARKTWERMKKTIGKVKGVGFCCLNRLFNVMSFANLLPHEYASYTEVGQSVPASFVKKMMSTDDQIRWREGKQRTGVKINTSKNNKSEYLLLLVC